MIKKLGEYKNRPIVSGNNRNHKSELTEKQLVELLGGNMDSGGEENGGGGNNGGGNIPKPALAINDVTFYDYDGTILHSYTKDEFLKLKEMPALPTQEGLICQGWNWSFENALNAVVHHGRLEVGATYITDDNSTRLYVRAGSILLKLGLVRDYNYSIDWGDGIVEDYIYTNSSGAVTHTHTYSKKGDYIVKIYNHTNTNIELGWFSSDSITSANTSSEDPTILRKLEVGAHFLCTGYTCRNCIRLKTITLPRGANGQGNYCYAFCKSLRFVVIPQETTTISNQSFAYNERTTKAICPDTLTSDCRLGDSDSSMAILPFATGTLDGKYIEYFGRGNISSVSSMNNLNLAEAISFSACTVVPTLSGKNISSYPNDMKIIVPDALYDEWIVATNWSDYAKYIIKKSEWNALNV